MCVLGFIAGAVWSVIGLLTPGAAVQYPAGSGCVATSGASCSYLAREVGSIEAVGTDWKVEIVRGARTVRYGWSDLEHPRDGVAIARDVIRPGDRVRAVTGETSPPFCGFVAVGQERGIEYER